MKYLDVKMKVYSPGGSIHLNPGERTVVMVKNRGDFNKYNYDIHIYTEKYPIKVVGSFLAFDSTSEFFKLVIMNQSKHDTVELSHSSKIGYVRYSARSGEIDLCDFDITLQ